MWEVLRELKRMKQKIVIVITQKMTSANYRTRTVFKEQSILEIGQSYLTFYIYI